MIFKLCKESNTWYYATESLQTNSLNCCPSEKLLVKTVSVWAFYFTMTLAMTLFLLYLTNVLHFSFFVSFWCNLEETSKNEGSIQVNKALSEEMWFKNLLLALLDFGYDVFAVAAQELSKEEHEKQ